MTVFLHFCDYLPLFEQTWLQFTQKRFVPNLFEIKLSTLFLNFCDDLPFEEDIALYLQKCKFSSPRDDFHQVWNWPASSGEDFKICSVYFYSFAIISPWRRMFPFIWSSLNPLSQRTICAKSCLWFWRSQKCKSLQTCKQMMIRKANELKTTYTPWQA
jgi:hypothetical protein